MVLRREGSPTHLAALWLKWSLPFGQRVVRFGPRSFRVEVSFAIPSLPWARLWFWAVDYVDRVHEANGR